jgi:hypothetical protein
MSERSEKRAVVYGAMFDEKDILETIHPSTRASSMLATNEDLNSWDVIDSFIENHPTFSKYGVGSREPEYDIYFIGREWDSIQDDETGELFKDNVAKVLKTFFGREVVCRTLVIPWEGDYETPD